MPAVPVATRGYFCDEQPKGVATRGYFCDGAVVQVPAEETKTRPYRGLDLNERLLTQAQMEDELVVLCCMQLLQLRRSKRPGIQTITTEEDK